jgi:phenylalanyl-tRNA synthetase alpha chain
MGRMHTDTLAMDLAQLATQVRNTLDQADSVATVENLRVQYLGKKGELTQLMKSLKNLPDAERPAMGAQINAVHEQLAQAIDTRLQALKTEALNARLAQEAIDVTMPGVYRPTGRLHPITEVTETIVDIFQGLGFQALDELFCPEVEQEYYNFEALNFPADHPARDMQDTFYTTLPGMLLRSQTSNAQIRFMENNTPPMRILAPGRVYRNEEVSSRKYVLFHQIEGLWVDTDVRFSDLKGLLQAFVTQFFGGEDRPIRFRSSFFPFTEPSAEVDVQCILCGGAGCRTCGGHGWLEILGAGMVDPNVLQQVNIDPEKYTGLAFGLGVERLAMLKFAIEDIRLFYQNDLRFLRGGAW